eukprot:7573032-Pyramimonas_sp.AAC.1
MPSVASMNSVSSDAPGSDGAMARLLKRFGRDGLCSREAERDFPLLGATEWAWASSYCPVVSSA